MTYSSYLPGQVNRSNTTFALRASAVAVVVVDCTEWSSDNDYTLEIILFININSTVALSVGSQALQDKHPTHILSSTCSAGTRRALQDSRVPIETQQYESTV